MATRGDPIRLALLLAVLLGACGGPALERRPDAPGGAHADDLLGLLPAGLDLIIDVDVAQLRASPSGAALWDLLPGDARAWIAIFGDAPLGDLDGLCVGVSGIGTDDLGVTVVARGRLAREGILGRFREMEAGAEPLSYHQITLWERAGPRPPGGAAQRALSFLTAGTLVVGRRGAVRQVIDIFQGHGEGVRAARDLLLALAKAPRAKVGRPAVLLALLPTPPLRQRLLQADLAELFADASYVAAALAVGDGIDLGVVAGYRELAQAQAVAEGLRERVRGLRGRALFQWLGAGQILDPLLIVAALGGKKRTEPEVHVAYRLPGDDLAALLRRVAALHTVREGVPSGTSERTEEGGSVRPDRRQAPGTVPAR